MSRCQETGAAQSSLYGLVKWIDQYPPSLSSLPVLLPDKCK